jgi:hypothetical protein
LGFSHWPSILLLFQVSEQFRHGGMEGGRQSLHDQNGGHALAALQQADVVTVQIGLGGESFLQKAGGITPAPIVWPLLQAAEKICERDVQDAGNQPQVKDGKIPLAALDRADESAVQRATTR